GVPYAKAYKFEASKGKTKPKPLSEIHNQLRINEDKIKLSLEAFGMTLEDYRKDMAKWIAISDDQRKELVQQPVLQQFIALCNETPPKESPAENDPIDKMPTLLTVTNEMVEALAWAMARKEVQPTESELEASEDESTVAVKLSRRILLQHKARDGDVTATASTDHMLIEKTAPAGDATVDGSMPLENGASDGDASQDTDQTSDEEDDEQ
ncbi:hypothetical protein HDU96_002001, partial [Phlyctochytrium bullatum]